MQAFTAFVLIPYKSGSVSDDMEPSDIVGLPVLIPYKSGSVSD